MSDNNENSHSGPEQKPSGHDAALQPATASMIDFGACPAGATALQFENMKKHKLGVTGWIDMCVRDPAALSDFYHKVIGWKPEPFRESPESATHYFMKDANGTEQLGICDMKEFEPWATGWVPYINVDDYDAIIERSRESGGEVLVESIFGSSIPEQRVALIRDPSGASVMICEIPEDLIDREQT